MRDILYFAIGASLIGTIFLVSSLELLFTIRRRKSYFQIESKIRDMKAQFNENVNKLVLDDSANVDAKDKQLEDLNKQMEALKLETEASCKQQIDEVNKDKLKEVEAARTRAKQMEFEARQKAEEYLAKRKREVEEELVQLVMSVSKKVIPSSISYEAQKELVARALNEVKENK